VEGKPVVFFWAAQGKPCSLFQDIRTELEKVVGPIYMTGNNFDPSCWDRMMLYNSYSPASGSYDAQLQHQKEYWRVLEGYGRPWAPTVFPGYDDTHVRDGNPAVPVDPEFFRRSIRLALAHDQKANVPWLFVCSWNEWHEGSNIEPSTDFAPSKVFLTTLRQELGRAGWIDPCDRVTQPAPHWGARNGQCLRSCGAMGGTNGSDVPCSSHGWRDVGTAYDVPYCCKS